MELHSPKLKTIELNEVEQNKEKTPTLEQIKKFGREFVSRVIEPLSVSSSTEHMSEDQRKHTGFMMAEAAINSTRY